MEQAARSLGNLGMASPGIRNWACFPCEIHVEKEERQAPLKERSRDVVSPLMASGRRQVRASLLAGREEAIAGRRKPDKTQPWVALGEGAGAGMLA